MMWGAGIWTPQADCLPLLRVSPSSELRGYAQAVLSWGLHSASLPASFYLSSSSLAPQGSVCFPRPFSSSRFFFFLIILSFCCRRAAVKRMLGLDFSLGAGVTLRGAHSQPGPLPTLPALLSGMRGLSSCCGHRTSRKSHAHARAAFCRQDPHTRCKVCSGRRGPRNSQTGGEKAGL